MNHKIMKIMYLGTTSNIEDYLHYYGKVDSTQEKITATDIKKYDWVVSYGYRHIIKPDVIQAAKNPIINLHISYLPWNRGGAPNYFSWKYDTPKGVTIHQINEGLDTGDIYVQKEVQFTGEETLATSYDKLKIEIESLFITHFDSIINYRILGKKQVGEGSYQTTRELPPNIDYNTKVTNI